MTTILNEMIGRRQLLAGAAATAATALLPARASAASPTDTRLLQIARRELDRLGARVPKQNVAALADFSMPSSEPRFFVLDMVSGSVKRFYVTHGRGSDPQHDGWLKAFSNSYGSNATSRGAYLMRNHYEGKHGLSVRLAGLDPDNCNAENRAIVLHSADYANPSLIRTMGKLGRSEGCFAFSEESKWEVLGLMGEPGAMIFADRFEGPLSGYSARRASTLNQTS